ncbi:MAG: hypothetical protein JW929_11965 [Anaerolineales bacterium]|nr:hypothetical protein [Anaerolineales bacterium]
MSAFISLESTIDEIKAKAKDFGWAERIEYGIPYGENYLSEVGHLGESDEFFTPESHAKNLLNILTRPDACPAAQDAPLDYRTAYLPCGEEKNHRTLVNPAVLLPMLTPREIAGEDEKSDTVFWRRFRQLEHLLMASRKLESLRDDDPHAVLSHLAQVSVDLARQLLRELKNPILDETIRKQEEERRSLLVGRFSRKMTQIRRYLTITTKKIKNFPTMSVTDLIAKLMRSASAAARIAEQPGDGWRQQREELNDLIGGWNAIEIILRNTWNEMVQQKNEWKLSGMESTIDAESAKIIKCPEARAILPLVVIDSLNMFSDKPLSRNQIHQLFRLFKRYRRIGVFIVETSDETPFDSTIADVVIRLSSTKDQGYAVRHIEIEKSRYSNHVRGLHPFKPIKFEKLFTPPFPLRNPPRSTPEKKEPARCGIVVYPSLHHIVLKTDSTQNPRTSTDDTYAKKTFAECFGIDDFDSVLAKNIFRAQQVTGRIGKQETTCLRGNVIMIEGDRGTLKTSIAMNFLVKGLIDETPESVMLIRLSDVPLIEQRDEGEAKQKWPILSSQISETFDWQKLAYANTESDWQNIAPINKVLIRKFCLRGREDTRDHPSSALFELDFKGGYILPEEFVQFVCDVLIRRDERNGEKAVAKIRRVVLGDVSQIGVSYPFLRESMTSGNIFLPTFVHLMRNYGISLVMVGTHSNVPEADEAVKKAATLADAVLSCRFVDVFGQRHVVISGGMTGAAEYESKLPVIRRERIPASASKEMIDCFKLEKNHLDGIVGLETASPHRPGLILHVFQEDGRLQPAYNQEMAEMLRAGLSRPNRREFESENEIDFGKESDALDVVVQPFNSQLSEAIHDSLDVLKDRPVNRTVLCTVDEFSRKSDDVKRQFYEITGVRDTEADTGESILVREELVDKPEGRIYVWPYICNVLLLAYRQTWFESHTNMTLQKGTDGIWAPTKWDEIWQAVASPESERNGEIRFWFDQTARETLSCMVIDALIAKFNVDGKYVADDPALGVRKDFLDKLLYEKTRQSLWSNPGNENGFNLNADDWTKELRALARLLSMGHKAVRVIAAERTKDPDPYGADAMNLIRSKTLALPAKANVYVCWYSQLRELVDWNAELAKDMRVCPLPGGGFRGDWYIGILKGSVSKELGREIIERLCRPEEDYKRFTRGVGLPVRKRFFEGRNRYFAWPLAIGDLAQDGRSPSSKNGITVPVSKVFEIYDRAWSRSDIDEYTKIRSALSLMAEQISYLDTEDVENEILNQFLDGILYSRLSVQLDMLRKAGK